MCSPGVGDGVTVEEKTYRNYLTCLSRLLVSLKDLGGKHVIFILKQAEKFKGRIWCLYDFLLTKMNIYNVSLLNNVYDSTLHIGALYKFYYCVSQQPITGHKISFHCSTKPSVYKKKGWQIVYFFKCSDRIVAYTNQKVS